MAAELRLGVAFDLVYFRQQLKKLGRIAASEFTAPIKIKLDRRVIDSELNNLQRAIKRRKYNIELNIAGSLSKKTFEDLQERLDALSKRDKVEIPLSIKNGIQKKDIDKTLAAIRGRINQHKTLRDGKIDIGVSIQPSITNKDVQDVKDAAKEKLDKLTALEIQSKIKTPNLEALLKALKKNLNRQDPLSAKVVIKPLSVAPPLKALQKDLNAQEPLSVKAIAKPATPAISKADVAAFKNEIEEKLSGIVVKVKADIQGGFAAGPAGAAGLYEYMRTQGLSGGNVPGAVEVGREERLRKALSEYTVKQLQQLAREQDISGVSRLRKDPLIDRLIADLNQDVAEGLLGNIKNQMRQQGGQPIRRSFLDQIARAIFYMAGVDPAYLRQQAAQRRALPGINFPATVPPGPGIGPSGSGRLLVGGASPRGLPGTAFGGKGFLPPQLGVELKEILRDAASAFVQSLMAQVRKVSVRDLGRRALPALPGASMRGLLPSAVGRAPSLYGQSYASSVQDRIAQAYQRSALRGAAVMAEGPRGGILGAGGSGAAGPYRPFAQGQPGGAIVPYRAPSYKAAFDDSRSAQISEAFKGVNQYLGKGRVPLTGAISELTSEFGNAVKQVLLFGTAYKALAFLTSLPGEAFNAAKGLETFRNQLNAVTEGSGQFGASLKFIENAVAQLNVPINSAREGFTRLYASLEPSGFDPETIQRLFTGITEASATFGLSADQVDRVFYAFGQMASKGQVMSEELKGQLGDVLPGSVALFAEAAKMSMTEFTAAMEDGAFKGEGMKVLLENVATLMSTRFSDAATKASQTLQGQVNAMQNALQQMYEQFGPIVDAIASAFGPQILGTIQAATDAIQALNLEVEEGGEYFKLMSPQAQGFYKILQSLKPSIEGAARGIGEFGSSLGIFIGPLITASKLILDFISIPFVGRVALYTATLALLTSGFQLLVKTGIVQAIAAVVRFIAVLNVAQIKIWVAGIQSAIASLFAMVGTLNKATIAAKLATAATVGFKLALVSLGVGAVIFVLDLVLQKMLGIGNAIDNAKLKTQQFKEELASAAAFGDTAVLSAKYTEAEQEVTNIQNRIAELERKKQQGTGLRLAGIQELGRLKQSLPEALNKAGQAKEAFEEGTRVALNRERQRKNAERDLKDVPLAPSDKKGPKAKRLTPMGLIELTKQLNAAKEEGRIIDEIEYQYKIDVLKASQETEDIARREIDLENAASKRRMEYGKLGEDIGRQSAQQLIEESEGRKEIAQIQNEQKFAAGEINAKEYERVKFLAEQRDLLEDFGNIPGVTDEQKSLFERLLGKIPEPGTIAAKVKEIKDEFDNLADSTNVISTAAVGIGESFSRAFTDILTGAQTWRDGLAGAFKSVAGLFADLVAQMLAKWAALQILGLFLPGQEGSSLTAGIKQYPLVESANGNVLRGGFAAFANGGMVTGPTLGLVGEGRFNEAVVPLPNGKSIPVDLGDGAGNNISTNIVVNMNNGQSSSKVTGTGSQAFGREIEGAVRSVILKETRPGGIIYGSR